MANERNRMTWLDRTAGNPPSTPGYDIEDQDHPAHQPEPAYEKYKKGDPSAWAEDVHQPPYPQGNPPSTPGYDVEDQDHPAHVDMPRVPKEANLKALVQRKASRCIRLAGAMLNGVKGLTAGMVEDQALDLMDWSDMQISAAEKRLAGGFLAAEDDKKEEKKEDKKACGPMADADGGGDMNGVPHGTVFADDDDLDAILSGGPGHMAMDKLIKQVASLAATVEKLAGQNDPKGDTLAPGHREEAAARKPGSGPGQNEGEARKPGSGSGMSEEEARKPGNKAAAEEEKEEEKEEKKASEDKEAKGKIPPQFLKNIKKKEDEKEEEEPPAKKKKKKADEEMEEEDVVEDKKKASEEEDEKEEKKASDEKDEDKEEKKSKKADEEEDEESDDGEGESKKAARSLFASFGGDADGFVTKADWTGNKAMFAAMDTDKDGIVAVKEFMSVLGCGEKAAAPALDAQEMVYLAEAEVQASEKDAPTVASAEQTIQDLAVNEASMFSQASDSMMASTENDKLLNEIFGGKSAAEDEDEEKEEKKAADEKDEEKEEKKAADEEEEKKEDKKAGKTASQRPQPRKPNPGVKSLGTQTRTASAGRDEVGDLTKLWASAPDVSSVFGTDKV